MTTEEDPLQLDEDVVDLGAPVPRRVAWLREIERELFRWRNLDECPGCHQRIGHHLDCWILERPLANRVPLEQVRPDCYTVRRHWIGDAIRAACEKRESHAIR